jgi:hypothetical protein
MDIDPKKMQKHLKEGKVVIVAGFLRPLRVKPDPVINV